MTDTLSRREVRTLQHQWDVLQAKERVIFFGGGVGVGKTTVGTLWHLSKLAAAGPGALPLICANTYPQLFDSTLRNVYRYLGQLGIPVKPAELPKSHSPFSLWIWINGHWRETLCRSLKEYETLSGVEISWWWADEVWQTEEAAIKLLLQRLRGEGSLNQGLMTTTLDEPDTWMYAFAEEAPKEDPSLSRRVIYAPSEANTHLPEGYLEELRSSLTDREYRRMVGAEWITLSTSVIYYAFSEANVSAEAEFDPALPILWSHDFNIGEGKPMSSILAQLKRGPGPNGKIRPELHVFDELVLETADTNDAVTEFDERGYDQECVAGIRVYGDASGRAKDTRSKTTDYGILADAGFADQSVPAANPAIRDRHNCVNGLLRSADGDTRILVHPRCKTLTKGLKTVKLRSGAQYLEEETYAQHVTTALGYLCWDLFPAHRGSGGMTVIPRPW